MAPGAPYRAMVADDSAVNRGLLTRLLESDPSIAVAASVPNGEIALRTLSRDDDRNVVRLSQDPPENYCLPSADPMFRSSPRFLAPDCCRAPSQWRVSAPPYCRSAKSHPTFASS
jgi:two-component system chemotaxis response regulator CheB